MVQMEEDEQEIRVEQLEEDEQEKRVVQLEDELVWYSWKKMDRNMCGTSGRR